MEPELANTNNITRSAARGAVALGLRQLFVQGSNIATGVILARILEPAEFALWGIMTFILNFLMVFGDAGLAASLVRQQTEPEERDYRAVFTVQQAMVLLVASVFWLMSPMLTELYKLSPDNVWIFRFVAVALFLNSLMAIPQAKLERNLAFSKLAIVEVAQAFVYNGSAILLVVSGVGTLSFGIALVLRSMLGVGLAYWASPWQAKLVWEWVRVHPHLTFGLPFQGSKLVNLIKDLITPTLFAFHAGITAVGYINWATMVMNLPLLAVVLLQRLYMPLFAKLASDQRQLRIVVSKIVSLICLVIYTSSSLIFVFREEITTVFFGDKWLDAMVLFLPFALINVLLAPTIIAMSLLNALGFSREVFFVTLSWMVLTWLLGFTAIVYFDWSAWGWANLTVNLPNLWLLWFTQKQANIEWFKLLWNPLLIAFTSALVAYLVSPWVNWIFAFGIGGSFALVVSHKVWYSALTYIRAQYL